MNFESLTLPGDAATALPSGADLRPVVGSGRDGASLHRHLFAEGSLDRDDAEALFDLERSGLGRGDHWTAFFVQAVTDHVVWGARPTGRLDAAQADWLIAQVDSARTPASFALLVNVLDEAQEVPKWFACAVRARAVAGWPGLTAAQVAGRSREA